MVRYILRAGDMVHGDDDTDSPGDGGIWYDIALGLAIWCVAMMLVLGYPLW